MATQTTNYGLKKPAYSDTADIGVINSNMDIIDAKMKEIEDKITNETDPTVPAWAKEPNKPTYTAEEVGALPSNTPIPDPTSVVVDRFVSAGTHIADISVNGEKTELYAPTGGGGTSVTIDSELSTTSENPVQNKVITQALNEKGTYSKPTSGIPKTDLASEVQTSLGKADTALQEHQDISGKADKTEVNALYNSISDAWNSATAYTVGQYCIHNNILWKCLVANTNTEPAEGTHWTQTTIDAEIASVNSSLERFLLYKPISISNVSLTTLYNKISLNSYVEANKVDGYHLYRISLESYFPGSTWDNAIVTAVTNNIYDENSTDFNAELFSLSEQQYNLSFGFWYAKNK